MCEREGWGRRKGRRVWEDSIKKIQDPFCPKNSQDKKGKC